jgi:hypothetical protein
VTIEFDLAQIIERNEKIVSGKRVLYVKQEPEKHSQNLLIVMSAHNHGEKYMALRSFLSKQTCDLLFITDPKNTWYLDDDNGATYQTIISYFTKNYESRNVFLFGSSMSGYGAILHALKLNHNAIASNPQINLDITKDYSWPELVEHISSIKGNHTNIEEIAPVIWKDSAVYIIHGHDDIDTINASLLLNAVPNNRKLIIQTVDSDAHTFYFGKNVDYVFDVISMLSIFRTKLDLSTTVNDLATESSNVKKMLRAERRQLNVIDPYRSLNISENAVSWQERYLHEELGKLVHFANIGLYTGSELSGGTCFYDGRGWRLISVPYEMGDNLIAGNEFITQGVISAFTNNAYFNDYWWIRNEAESSVTISGAHNFCEIVISEAKNKNIYINSSIPSNIDVAEIKGQYLTFTADIYTSEGEVSLTLGGVGDVGYHHKNSEKNTPGTWSRLVVFEQFTSIKESHKDRIFVRFNLATDGKPKVIRIKNACLAIGYFPMGFTE